MSYLEESEWMLLNETAYNVSFIYDFDEMRTDFLKWIRLLIDYDGAVFSFVRDGKVINSIAKGVPEQYVKLYDEEFENDNPLLWFLMSNRNHSYCQSEIISDERMKNSKFYQLFYKPNNYVYAMSMNIVFIEDVVGLVTFYRTAGKGDFSRRDMFALDQLQKHLAYRLYYEAKKGDSRFFYAKGVKNKIAREFSLTTRESDIMELAVKGFSNEQIAGEMGISVNTVKKHFHNLYEKMNVKNRVQLLQCFPQASEKINFNNL